MDAIILVVCAAAALASACTAHSAGLKTVPEAQAAHDAIVAECGNLGHTGPKNRDAPFEYRKDCERRYLKTHGDLGLAKDFARLGNSMFGGRDYSYGPGGRYGGVFPRGGWY